MTADFAPTASIEQRLDAIQTVLQRHGMQPDEFIQTFDALAHEHWVPANGADVGEVRTALFGRPCVLSYTTTSPASRTIAVCAKSITTGVEPAALATLYSTESSAKVAAAM